MALGCVSSNRDQEDGTLADVDVNVNYGEWVSRRAAQGSGAIGSGAPRTPPMDVVTFSPQPPKAGDVTNRCCRVFWNGRAA